ncbi:MAG: hypothetical protein K9M51_02520 [Candidatus Gracilibacteria bacterium]|nr:hypothetical protein [Candidatus Gracilibacteria bacterium]
MKKESKESATFFEPATVLKKGRQSLTLQLSDGQVKHFSFLTRKEIQEIVDSAEVGGSIPLERRKFIVPGKGFSIVWDEEGKGK